VASNFRYSIVPKRQLRTSASSKEILIKILDAKSRAFGKLSHRVADSDTNDKDGHTQIREAG